MANEKRLIDLATLGVGKRKPDAFVDPERAKGWNDLLEILEKAPAVDAYTAEQVASIIQQANQLEAKNKELEKECSWLKSCLNCKIRKKCPRHCGKVVHGCDHWEYGDSTVDAVEAVQRWMEGNKNERQKTKGVLD